MTNEVKEALDLIESYGLGLSHKQAVKVIRMALEQQPCADCINREDTLKEFKRVYFDNATVIRCAELILGSMSPVTPTNEDIKEAYLKGYDYGVKDWFKSKTQPCDDCVSREAVIEDVIKCTDMNEDTMEVLENKVKALPSVYPERPKGKWITQAYSMRITCTNCKKEIWYSGRNDYKYCPSCGADMRGENNGNMD